ncbi:MAG: DUF6089 family protein [Bacteroidales bacterium]|nr:DUF6089 family protein [Bacteroidales bacterium]HRT00465.1 DUF6089 family protein [Bacteroidales bacterium]HRT80939.1 DUF6089 family protein [Bacteroidales bacterium]
MMMSGSYKQILYSLKVLFVVLLFNCSGTKTFSQKGIEFGGHVGGAYYMGDLNLSNHFYQPHLNFGGFFRYHFNGRYNLRLNGLYTRLSADDADFNNRFQVLRDRRFETSLIELAGMFEINFKPYLIGDTRKESFTPYLQAGLALYLANSAQDIIGVAIPIGFGVKKNLTPRLVLGAEWSFRKTFSDYLDSVSGEDLSNYDSNYGISVDDVLWHKQRGFRYHKDWYSIASITLSYTFKIGGLGCPAYYQY